MMSDVLANGLERIEVLRGPQSTLYGSDAIGGIINLITKRGGDDKLTLSAEAGSLDTVRLNAAGSGSYSSFEYGAAANFYTTNSVSAADYKDGNKEADGYHHFGATGNVRWHATEEVSLDARLYYTRARDSFDGYPAPAYTFADTHEYGDNQLLALYGGINGDFLGGRFTNRLAFTYTGSDRDTYDTVNNYWANGTTDRIEYQGGYKLDDANELSFGYEHQRTGMSTQSAYDLTATHGADTVDGVYGQWQSTVLPGVTLTAGGRFDHDSEFGDHTSYKLNAAWQINENTTLRGNVGNGFKAPSLYQLYSTYSNPVENLKPEQATGWEIGLDRHIGSWMASLTYFQRQTTNQIDFFSCYGVTSTACNLRLYEGGYYYNVARSLARGIEFQASGHLSDTVTATVSYTNLTDINQDTRLQLARRPHDTASGTLTWKPLESLTLGGTLTYIGGRFNDAYQTTELKERAELGLFGSVTLTKELELYGRVDNLFDNRDETVTGYGTIGQTFYAGIRAKL